MIGRRCTVGAMIVMAMALSACAESAHQTGLGQLGQNIPEDLRRLVDESIAYQDVKASPGSYSGKTVMFGGVVLRAKRLRDKTEVEMLQLPLGTDGIPVEDRSQSQGRFILTEESFLDPATLEAGTPLTAIGTVEGETSRPLSEGEDTYTYPVIRILQLLNWPTLPQANTVGGWAYQYNPYAFYGPSYWGPSYYGYPYWSPWGYGGYGRYYGGSYDPPRSRSSGSGASSGSIPPQFGGGSGGFSGSSSSGSPSSSIPPQFQKRRD